LKNPLDFPGDRHYIDAPHMEAKTPSPEWKKVSAEMLILSLVEARPRHGYEISKLIEQRSGGTVCFYVASLYPLLYRLEKRGWVEGRWVEKAGQRRRRYYRLTAEGRRVLASQRRGWQAFVAAVNRIVEVEHA
jgi:PadR family transcriptional regulator PadR